nr:MAG TPA: hypothetical protein [Caudoviricetes sp.]
MVRSKKRKRLEKSDPTLKSESHYRSKSFAENVDCAKISA